MAETDPIRARTIQFLVTHYQGYLETLSTVGLQRTLLNYLSQRASLGQTNQVQRQDARLEQLLELVQETAAWTSQDRIATGLPHVNLIPPASDAAPVIPPGILSAFGGGEDLPDYLRDE